MSKGVRGHWEKAIQRYGFETYDEQALQSYLAASPKLIKKAIEQSGAGCWGPYRGGACGSCGNVAAAMQGGRIALAGEYFGLKTSPLVDHAAATDMTHLTDNYVRPAVNETFFGQQTSAPACGGGWQNELFSHALKSYRATHKGLRLTAQQKGGMQAHFDESLNAAFLSIRKTASKTKHLKAGMVEKALKKN